MKSFPEISYVKQHIGLISNKKFEFNEAVTLRETSSSVTLGRLLDNLYLHNPTYFYYIYPQIVN